MIVDLLRHGETGQTGFRGRLDDALTPSGWAQMRARVDDAADDARPWQHIVSSPRRRCAEFAAAVAAQRNLPLDIDVRLAELDFGDWEGADAMQLMQQPASANALRRFWKDPWHHPPPRGESMEAFETRLRAAWHDLAMRHAGRRLLLIAHAGTIRLLLCLAHGLPRNTLLERDVPHASLHRIEGALHLPPTCPCRPCNLS